MSSFAAFAAVRPTLWFGLPFIRAARIRSARPAQDGPMTLRPPSYPLPPLKATRSAPSFDESPQAGRGGQHRAAAVPQDREGISRALCAISQVFRSDNAGP